MQRQRIAAWQRSHVNHEVFGASNSHKTNVAIRKDHIRSIVRTWPHFHGCVYPPALSATKFFQRVSIVPMSDKCLDTHNRVNPVVDDDTKRATTVDIDAGKLCGYECGYEKVKAERDSLAGEVYMGRLTATCARVQLERTSPPLYEELLQGFWRPRLGCLAKSAPSESRDYGTIILADTLYRYLFSTNLTPSAPDTSTNFALPFL